MQRNEKQQRRLSSFLTSIAVTNKFIASNCMLNIHKVDLIYTATLKVFNYCKIKNDTFFWVFFIPQHFITIEQYKCVSDSLIITIRNRFFWWFWAFLYWPRITKKIRSKVWTSILSKKKLFLFCVTLFWVHVSLPRHSDKIQRFPFLMKRKDFKIKLIKDF